jgi:hypothetical protein
MARAYICDRCGDAKTGESFARVFLDLNSVPTVRSVAQPKTLARHEDLCESCTDDIRTCINTAPVREAHR